MRAVKGRHCCTVNKNLTADVIGYIARETSPVLTVTNSIFGKRLGGSEAAAAGRIVDIEALGTAGGPRGAFEQPAGGERPALILYTSGTTKIRRA
jgi:acyl-coenzyme A synthetase/AMP-(fatty) acid ligase